MPDILNKDLIEIRDNSITDEDDSAKARILDKHVAQKRST